MTGEIITNIHVETALVICSAARDASNRGDYELAAKLYKQSLDRSHELHGADSIVTGLVLISLMNFHERAGQPEEAAQTWLKLDAVLGKHGIAAKEIPTHMLRACH